MSFTIGSLFDGSGGFPLAAFMYGGVPKWAAEIEPYPIAVTKSRFPHMKHLGSVIGIKGNEIEPVDVITFGSPCQDLSVAGKRAGLKHEDNGDDETTRSGLFMEAVRIIEEMREATNGVYPRIALWENVPGAFSSNKGEDFRIVLEELIKIIEPTAVMPTVPKNGWPYADCYSGDGWSLAYRVLDAQYWGVPQRRKRIFLVLDLGGQCAGEISFKREGLRGYFEEGRAPWQGVAGNAERGSGTADCEGKCVAYSFDSLASNSMKSKNPHSGCRQVEVAKTLDCFDPNPSKNQGGIAVLEPVLRAEAHGNVPCVMDAIGFDMYNQQSTGGVSRTLKTPIGGDDLPVACVAETLPFDTTQVTSPMNYSNPKWGDPCHPLAAGAHPPAVVCKCYDARDNGEGGICPTITGDHNNRVTDYTCVVCEPTICLEGNGNRPSHSGNGWSESDVMYTLNTIERHGVCYSMKVIARNGKALVEQANPICASDYKDPDIVAYPCVYGVDCRNATEYPEMTGALQADCAHNLNSNSVVRTHYIVRRLTPSECSRLQGFPDFWGHPDKKTEFTDEEYEFWLNVRNTHAEINGKATKDYTKDQMLTWYNKLHTDSSEYKLWGNGIALPCALYFMQGIAEVFK